MSEDVPPLAVTYSEIAEAELDDAYQWMLSFGFDVGERWLTGLTELLSGEAMHLASFPFQRPLAPESSPERPLFILRYRTGRRGSSAWQVVYELVDEDEDGMTDTLRVVRIRHASRG